ncbi:MAG: hypothetical protein EON93_01440 [Burkholderiales bacterium]|nr:MAG: hypothetical protein EON93_01440 [Burkholderiales bacterium]
MVVSASGSPASPFYFMLYPKEGKYVVVGEGTGPKNVTDRAYAELARLTGQDVADLIASAKSKGVAGGQAMRLNRSFVWDAFAAPQLRR